MVAIRSGSRVPAQTQRGRLVSRPVRRRSQRRCTRQGHDGGEVPHRRPAAYPRNIPGAHPPVIGGAVGQGPHGTAGIGDQRIVDHQVGEGGIGGGLHMVAIRSGSRVPAQTQRRRLAGRPIRRRSQRWCTRQGHDGGKTPHRRPAAYPRRIAGAHPPVVGGAVGQRTYRMAGIGDQRIVDHQVGESRVGGGLHMVAIRSGSRMPAQTQRGRLVSRPVRRRCQRRSRRQGHDGGKTPHRRPAAYPRSIPGAHPPVIGGAVGQ